MAEVYVTLGEAAELERVKYNTMVKRVLHQYEKAEGRKRSPRWCSIAKR